MEERTLTVRISTRSFVIGLALLIGAAAVVWLESVLVILVLAAMLATALGPAVAYFENRLRLSRGPAVAAVFLLLLGALLLFCMVVIPTLIDQARALTANLPSYGEKLRGSYTWLRIFDARFVWLPDFNILREALQVRVSGWAESGLGFAGKVFGTMFMVFIVMISAFYALIDSPRLKRGFLRLIPRDQRDLWGAQLDPIGLKIGAYVRGVLTSISVLVVYLGITLSLAGVPLSLVLALLAGCFEIIPTLGPVLGAIPAILVALTVSSKLAVIVFAIFAFGIFVQSNFVAPMLYSREVELPPLLITVALLIGGELMGVLGAMIAVPVLAVLVVLLENLYLIPREAAHRPENPEATS